RIAPAVAKAAMESGVATRPIVDFDAYEDRLEGFVYQSGFMMKPIFDRAKRASKDERRRLVYAEGAHPFVLQAAQQVVREGLARPIFVGRREVIKRRITHLGLRMREGDDYEICDQEHDARVPEFYEEYHRLVERKCVSPTHSRRVVRAGANVTAGLLLRRGDADAMICGAVGRYHTQLRHVNQVVGKRLGVQGFATLSGLILPRGPLFITDTYVSVNPTAEKLAEITLLAADEVRRFGIEPKVALLSHSDFGTENTETALKMRAVLAHLEQAAPELEVEGEMQADTAISPFVREEIFPNSRLTGAANLLVMPTLDAANIAFNLLKAVSRGTSLGPILLGARRPVHIVTPAISVRGLLNMSAIAISHSLRETEDAGEAPQVGHDAVPEPGGIADVRAHSSIARV
ncbi:MAG: phosphate acyltransferase, partial [Pseudomonadota bacterium]